MAGQGSPGLASPRFAWRGIYSEVTLTAYLPARALRRALVPLLPSSLDAPMWTRSVPFIATPKAKNEGEFTATPTVLRVIAAKREQTATYTRGFQKKKKSLHLMRFDFEDSAAGITRNERHVFLITSYRVTLPSQAQYRAVK